MTYVQQLLEVYQAERKTMTARDSFESDVLFGKHKPAFDGENYKLHGEYSAHVQELWKAYQKGLERGTMTKGERERIASQRLIRGTYRVEYVDYYQVPRIGYVFGYTQSGAKQNFFEEYGHLAITSIERIEP